MAVIKYVSPEKLEYFKTKQDAQNDDEFAQKTSVPTKTSDLSNDSGYQTQTQVSALISQAIASVMTYKGVKATTAELPQSGNKVGDVWHVSEDESEWAWNGTEWEQLGPRITVTWDSVTGKPSAFTPATHTHVMNDVVDMPSWSKQPSKPTYTYSEVGAASSTHSHAAFRGATSGASGAAGFVPAPSSGNTGSFLRSDGTWADVPAQDTFVEMSDEEIDALFK